MGVQALERKKTHIESIPEIKRKHKEQRQRKEKPSSCLLPVKCAKMLSESSGLQRLFARDPLHRMLNRHGPWKAETYE